MSVKNCVKDLNTNVDKGLLYTQTDRFTLTHLRREDYSTTTISNSRDVWLVLIPS